MELQHIDFLSSPVSLYFNNKRTHTSKISGILAIIFLLSCISYSSILLYNLINHLDAITLIYNVDHNKTKLSLFHFDFVQSNKNLQIIRITFSKFLYCIKSQIIIIIIVINFQPPFISFITAINIFSRRLFNHRHFFI